MWHSRICTLLTLGAVTAGCYHATIETGLEPGTQTVHKTFAASWIAGLVPPSTVSAASQCTSGVARVETQLSFVNQLVGLLTLGIYTPMEIKVTCAASRSGSRSTQPPDLAVREDAGPGVYQSVFATAAEQAMTSGKAVLVSITPTAPAPE